MENTERDFSYPLAVEVAQLDEKHNLKLSAYQTLIARLTELHVANINYDVSVTLRYGLAWAFISLSFEVQEPIHECLILHGRSWFSVRRGPYFRREVEFRDSDGRLRFAGSTFSVLLNIENRSVFHKRETPFYMQPPIGNPTIAADPRFREQLAYDDIDHRVVRPSYLDLLGHVNNCRYGDFATDALSPAERGRLGLIKRADFYFQSELRPDDRFTIQKTTDTDAIYIAGRNDTKNDLSFYINLKF
ncbi:MAG TPA: hypothetical protein GX726_00240 [Clostridiales bacterium]|jgi:acyl-ACP thioesterase|nr:hypothetical protein [Clostridiales bacterium]